MANYVDGKRATRDKDRSSFYQFSMLDSLSMACDFHCDLFCEICSATKKLNLKPEAFCNDCVQFLCKDCLRVHRRLQAARGHVIRQGDDMPKSMADKPPKFDYCDVHQQNRKDHFCGKHKVLVCIQCVSLHHTDCPVESVDDACKGVPSSEINVLYDKVRNFKTNLSSVIAQIDQVVTELGKQKIDLLTKAQEMKEENIDIIENLFQDFASEAESTYKTQTAKLGHGKNKLKDIAVNVEGTMDDIDKLKGSPIDTKVFLKIQDILIDVEECKSDTEKLSLSEMNVKMSFTPNKRMKEMFSSLKMGSISINMPQSQVTISVPEISFPISSAQSIPVPNGPCDSTTGASAKVAGKTPSLSAMQTKELASNKDKPSSISDQVGRKRTPISPIQSQKLASYNVKLKLDKSDCWITGIAFTSDCRCLLADRSNRKIKLFSQDMKILGALSLSTPPWDIAVTGVREAIVSCLEDSKLLILDTSDSKVSIKGTIKLPFTVVGIAPYKNKMIVIASSTSPRSIHLIDKRGKIYWSTDRDQQGRQIFSVPWYVTCTDDGGPATVVVSDKGNYTLITLNADTGDVITRRQVEGTRPTGVTTDKAGNIYVCYNTTGEVAVLTKDFSKERVLLSKKDGVCWAPKAIAYDAVRHQLYVSYASDTFDCFVLS